MLQQPAISVFVKLGYWDLYRSNVVLTASVFRKLLYIWGFVAVLWLTLSVVLLFRPSPEQDWAAIMQNASPLKWVLSLPVRFVFVVPLLSARRLLKDSNFQDRDADCAVARFAAYTRAAGVNPK